VYQQGRETRQEKEITMTANGGTQVKGGFYFNLRGLRIVAVSGKTGLLTGEPSERFMRIPAVAVLLLAPVLGGMFVVFLPIIGFVLVGQYLARLAGMGARRLVGSVAGNVTPDRRPGESYLAGKPEEMPAAKPEDKEKK
jgi:hypothetical protein